VVALTLAAALLALEMWRAARRLTGDDEAALLAWALALVPPVAFYAFEIYTEVPAALALAVALRLLLSGSGLGMGGAAAAAAARVGSPLAAPEDAAGGGRAGRDRALPAAPDGDGPSSSAWPRSWPSRSSPTTGRSSAWPPRSRSTAACRGTRTGSPLRAFVGLALDRSFGLLPYAPVFLIALAGLARLVRLRAWESLLAGAAVIVPVLPWRMWWGGQCPPARFLVPLVPLLALALAARVTLSRTGLARWRWPLALLGVAATIGYDRPPGGPSPAQPRRPSDAPVGPRFGETADRDLPAVAGREHTRRVARGGGVAGRAGAPARPRRVGAAPRSHRSPVPRPGLPIVLMLTIGIAVDTWARRAPPGNDEGRHPG
jgi:hypothetical protein